MTWRSRERERERERIDQDENHTLHAAAVQYVRKVSGLAKPSSVDNAAFELAIEEVAQSTERLLRSLSAQTLVRTREGEREKARARWTLRAAREPSR